jgi:hypothetical protein
MRLTRFFGLIFFIVSLFPYLGFKSLDTQPWPIAFGLFYLFLLLLGHKLVSFDRTLIFLIFLSFFGLAFSVSFSRFDDLFLLFRGIASYISIPIFYFAFREIVKERLDSLFVILVTNLAWLAGALLQLIFGSDVLNFFIFPRTTDDRGFTSFATEPTFFGYIILIYSVYYLLSIPSGGFLLRIILLINIASLFFLSKSSLCILLIVVFVFFKFFSVSRVFRNYPAVIGVVGIVCFFYYVNMFMSDTRMFSVMQLFWENPFVFFALDASANSRLADILIPLYLAFFENWLVPGGFNTIGDATAMHASSVFGNFFFYEAGGARIMSFFASLVYELGLFGVLIFLLVTRNVFFGNHTIFAFKVSFGLFIVSSVPVAFPPLYYILAKIDYNANAGCRVCR